MKFILFCMLAGTLRVGTVAAQADDGGTDAVRMVIAVSLDNRLLQDIEVTLLCTSGSPGRLETRLDGREPFEWRVSQFEEEPVYCQAYASIPRGFSIDYRVSGDSAEKADENGCQYVDVKAGDANNCEMIVTQDHVPLTVYKKWIGASGDEPDIEVRLDCDGHSGFTPRFVNRGLPATWQIDGIPPDGLTCSVSEAPDESFTSDETDCRDLILQAGRGEACTMVNTKVVKRIEMLNRYGKIIMIVVMMVAGLIAVRRFV